MYSIDLILLQLSGGPATEAYAEAYQLIVKFLKDQVSA